MLRLLAVLCPLVGVLPALAADPPTLNGFWRFSQSFGTVEQGLFVLKVETKDGQPIAEITGDNQGWKLSDFRSDGSKVTFKLANLGATFTFEGIIDAKQPDLIRGSVSDDSRVVRVTLRRQEDEKLESPASGDRPAPPKPIAEAQKLSSAFNQLRLRILRTMDAEERKELQEQLKKAEAELNEKLPGLLKEVLAKHADSPFAVEAATQLLRQAHRIKPSAEELQRWITIIEDDARLFGPRVTQNTMVQVVELLVNQKEVAALAVPLAERLANALKDADPLAVQSRTLKLWASALEAAGRPNAALSDRINKIEAALDAEYLKKVPPFKPEKFTGRKDKEANRVVVMELFTGAQCPPCVAADVAFDALEKVYEPKDLILIQYHMHIPGPDPLTNLDSIARWDYYRKLFPKEVRGTPTTLFNGKVKAGGGGGMPQAEAKFRQYKSVIDELLEQKTSIAVTGSAQRTGDQLSIHVNVDGVEAPNDHLKLRVLVLEEVIKYVGSNQLRFHHHVVRAVPEAKDGFPITGKTTTRTVAVDLASLRKDLQKYLDDFHAKTPFPNPDRPLDLKRLKAIAIVQNDDDGEILQGVQIDVKDAK